MGASSDQPDQNCLVSDLQKTPGGHPGLPRRHAEPARHDRVGVTPYRIETERLVIRCWEPEDAPLLKDAVDRSLEHLRPWMPWAPDEPEPLDTVYERLRTFRAGYDRDENLIMGVFEANESRAVGGTGLHPG